MNRNKVIVDGTKPGSARLQPQGLGSELRPAAPVGLGEPAPRGHRRRRPSGVNGLMVWKAANVSIENLTACNFLGGSRRRRQRDLVERRRRQRQGRRPRLLRRLPDRHQHLPQGPVAAGEFSAAQYGIFSSNWSGGTWDQIYASNFNDSGFYIGACQQVCNQTVNHAWARVQRARLLGLELGRAAGDRELRSSTTTRTGSTPTARTATAPAAERRLPGNGVQPRSPTPTRAGCSSTTTCTTTTTPTCPRRARRRPARSAPGCRSPAGATTRSWTTASPTTTPGASIFVPYPGQRPAVHRRNVELAAVRHGAACSTSTATR